MSQSIDDLPPLPEIMASVFVNEQAKMQQLREGRDLKELEDSKQAWAELPAEEQALVIAAMAEVADVLGILGIYFRVQNKGGRAKETEIVHNQQTPVVVHARPRVSVAPGIGGYVPATQTAPALAGNFCHDCGSPNLIRTGTCETCQECGSTSGCA